MSHHLCCNLCAARIEIVSLLELIAFNSSDWGAAILQVQLHSVLYKDIGSVHLQVLVKWAWQWVSLFYFIQMEKSWLG